MLAGRRSGIIVLVLLLLLGGCASKRVYREPRTGSDPVAEETPGDRPVAPPAQPRSPAEVVELGLRVATMANDQVGRPYAWGGESPGQGFDCSGLVQWSYGCVGIALPRVVRQQKLSGRNIDGDRLEPGDLVFFATRGRDTDHVGIYLGGRRFVHAPRSGQPVRVDSLDDAWWRGHWTESRRVIGD